MGFKSRFGFQSSLLGLGYGFKQVLGLHVKVILGKGFKQGIWFEESFKRFKLGFQVSVKILK